MILFYSEFCQHCNVLLDTIKRFDKDNAIKLISVDTLRSLRKPIDHKIHSVPALYLVDKKKYLFGKEVFDFLILKNKFSFSGENTRDNKKMKDINHNTSGSTENNPTQPQAFALGAITAECFSSIDDANNGIVNDKNYNWDFISNDDSAIPVIAQPEKSSNSKDTSDSKKLPSLEDIMKQRANDIS